MSSPLAIAAVTEILDREIRAVIEADLGLASPDLVTVGSPQRTRQQRTDPQVNLCLYQVNPNAAWRNQDLPSVKSGERAAPLLAIKLEYLITVFGNKDDDRQAHQMLGSIMLRLHDRSVLPRAGSQLAQDSRLTEQIEAVRLSMQPLTLDEMTKLWSAFQSPYQLSAAYEVSALLIESRQPSRSGPPVLSRGDAGADLPEDRGFPAAPFVPEPRFEGVRYAKGQSGLEHGAKLTLLGANLDCNGLRVIFRHPRLKAGRIARLAPTAIRKAGSIEAVFPNDFLFVEEDAVAKYELLKPVTGDRQNWPAGVYTVAGARIANVDPLDVNEPEKKNQPLRLFSSSPTFVGLLPRPINLPATLFVDRRPGDATQVTNAEFEIDLATPLHLNGDETDQAVRIFVGSLELPGRVSILPPVGALLNGQSLKWVAADPAPTVAAIYGLPSAARFLRVQVDGVDSSMLAIPADPNLLERKYDDKLLITITDPENPL